MYRPTHISLFFLLFIFFFFNDTATPEIYTLSLHDALPICVVRDEVLLGLVASGRIDDEVPRLGVVEPARADRPRVAVVVDLPGSGDEVAVLAEIGRAHV